VLGVFIIFAFMSFAASGAMAAEPVKLEVYDPTGSIQVTQTFAPRLASLQGKTICEVSNGLWEVDRMFPAITDALKKQFPTVNIIDHTKLPSFTAAWSVADLKNMANTVKAAGCQATIVGNAG
jgi:hypothetical protein